MTSIVQYLRQLDADMYRIDQEIAVLQLEKMRLQDARMTIMRNEEARALRSGHQSPFGTFPNGGQVAVTDPQLQPPPEARIALLEEGVLSKAAKTGQPAKLNGGGKKTRGPRQRGELRVKVLAILKDMPKGEGMTSGDIGNFLGLPAGTANRHPLHNCINHMKLGGLVEPVPGTPMSTGIRGVYQLTQRGHQMAEELGR